MRRKFQLVLIIIMLVFASALIYELRRPYRQPNAVDRFIDGVVGRDWEDDPEYDDEVAAITYVEVPADADLSGLVYVTPERQAYQDGAMRIIIPALGVDLPVSNGVTLADLKKGPGLFDYAALPGEGDRNTSIAGHRSSGVFYYLDKLKEGDCVYLVYDGHVFTYLFKDRKDVEPTDWSVLTNQGFSCLTLITCDPIKQADHRMIVRCELQSVEDAPADGNFQPSTQP
ncbi:MAG: class E sortase [Defluviitaleaceae bacterium]|nr:class E sortase [Defluviitaleaceae bacterium]